MTERNNYLDEYEESDPLIHSSERERTVRMGTISTIGGSTFHENTIPVKKRLSDSSIIVTEASLPRKKLPPRHPSPSASSSNAVTNSPVLKNGAQETPKISNSSGIRKNEPVEPKLEESSSHRRTRSNGADGIQYANPFQSDLHPELKRQIDATSYQKTKPNPTTRAVPNSIMDHFSYMINDDSSLDSLSDDVYSQSDHRDWRNGRVQPRNSGFKVSTQKKGTKRSLVLLTVAFVIVTIAHRNYHDPDSPYDSTNFKSHEDNNSDIKSSLESFCQESTAAEKEILAIQNISSVTHMPHGAVSADDQRCSKMGVSVMKDMNGNAMDAAVTTALCLGLVNPASSGIGGGAFILVHSPLRDHPFESGSSLPFLDRRKNSDESSMEKNKKRTEVIDCREAAPGKATFDMFESLPVSASTLGTLSIAVPGELRGLEIAHARFGSLTWKEVLQPVISLAEKGVTVSHFLAKEIFDNRETIEQYEATRRIFTSNNDGKNLLVEGDLMTRPSYTNTLKQIAEFGADYVYTGKVAAILAQEIQEFGGIISFKDILNYKPILRDPLVAQVNGISIASVPPPSSGGGTVIGALRFLSGYKNPFALFDGGLSTHRFVEALKHVFAIRMSLSDPDFFSNVTQSAVQDLISGTFMEHLRQKTLDNTILPLSAYGGKWALINSTDDTGNATDAHEGDRRLQGNVRRRTRLFNYLEDHGTTHLNVVDKHRNSVAITSSVNYYFGSKFASPSTGIIFNNVMDDFATPGRPNIYGLIPAESNYVAPNKRPLSSMAPTMVFDSNDLNLEDGNDHGFGRLLLVLGASGGPKIISAVLQVILNRIYLGMSTFDSIIHPRIHNQLLYHDADATGYEQSELFKDILIETSNRTRTALEKRNQSLFSIDYMGTCQAISVDYETDLLSAVSDPRKYGQSSGY